MAEKVATAEDRYAAYVVHTLSCRICWATRKPCPTAVGLGRAWREARR